MARESPRIRTLLTKYMAMKLCVVHADVNICMVSDQRPTVPSMHETAVWQSVAQCQVEHGSMLGTWDKAPISLGVSRITYTLIQCSKTPSGVLQISYFPVNKMICKTLSLDIIHV